MFMRVNKKLIPPPKKKNSSGGLGQENGTLNFSKKSSFKYKLKVYNFKNGMSDSQQYPFNLYLR